MTLASGSTTSLSFVTNGSTVQFALSGLSFRDTSDLVLSFAPTLGSFMGTLTPGVDFTTRGNTLKGIGRLYLNGDALPAGTLTVTRRTPARQNVVFSQAAKNNFADFETACDDLARQNADVRADLTDIRTRAVQVPPTSPMNAAAVVQTLLALGARELAPALANPATRADGSALVAGDTYFNTLANERRTWRGAAWASDQLPNTSPSNFFAANPVLASNVTYYLADPSSIITAFTPSLAAAVPRFCRFTSLGGNADFPIIKNDGGAAWLTLRKTDGSQILAGELGPAGYVVEAIEYADRMVVLNPAVDEFNDGWLPVVTASGVAGTGSWWRHGRRVSFEGNISLAAADATALNLFAGQALQFGTLPYARKVRSGDTLVSCSLTRSMSQVSGVGFNAFSGRIASGSTNITVYGYRNDGLTEVAVQANDIQAANAVKFHFSGSYPI